MISPSIQRLFAVIDSFRDGVAKTGSVPEEGIDKVEQILEVRFPEDYRAFLSRYGAITIREVSIYGISYPVDREPSIVWALTGLWHVFPDIPKNLIPIRDLSESGGVVCIQCPSAQSETHDATVVKWKFDPAPDEANPADLGQDFAAYVSNILMEIRHRQAALKVLEEHVQDFERDYLSAGKMARNHVWRPFRFCSQDVVLGLAVVRHSVDSNCLEVDVCLTSDIPEYEEGSGAKVMTSFLLSEAYKCGGTMEIRFSNNVEDGHVPLAICDLADRYGVALEHVADGRITPTEARRLYVAITEFSSMLRQQIETLARVGRLSEERACYAVHHGLWTRGEVESVILGSPRPDSILGGDALPEQRHLYLNDLLHARAAVMGGLFDRKLAKRERGDGSEAVDLEDDVRPLEISFDPIFNAKQYLCSEDLQIPWGVAQQHDAAALPAGDELVALVRARDADDLRLYLKQDIGLSAQLAVALAGQADRHVVCVLVPRDFEELPVEMRDGFAKTASDCGIRLLICPETTLSLDTDAGRRLASSRITRE